MLPSGFGDLNPIAVMENAALNAMKPRTSTPAKVRSARASMFATWPRLRPAGALITGEAEVTEVDGRRIAFTIPGKRTEPGSSASAHTSGWSSVSPSFLSG